MIRLGEDMRLTAVQVYGPLSGRGPCVCIWKTCDRGCMGRCKFVSSVRM